MLIAILAAVGSVALGASLALLPRAGGSALGPVRTFALIAAITVVAGHLLPDAAAELGPIALALVVLGVVLPAWVEEAIGAPHDHAATGEHAAESGHGHPPRRALGLELGYAALLLHHVGDGVALFHYGEVMGAGLDVIVALAAHTLPVTAVVVIQYRERAGARVALGRAAALAVASVAGAGLGAAFPGALHAAEPWIAAIVSGFLLHVIGHELSRDPPATARARVVDLAAAGSAVVLTSAASSELDLGFLRKYGEVLLDAAPAALVGLTASAWLGGQVSRLPAWLMFAAVPPRSVLTAAALARGRSAVSIALGSPLLRVESVLLALWLLGPLRAMQWLAGGVLLVFVGVLLGAPAADATRATPALVASPTSRGLLGRLEEAVHHAAPWLLVGALGAVYAEAGFDGAPLEGPGGQLLQVAAVTLAVGPVYLASVATFPLAAALLAKGAPWAPVLAGLWLGPALNVRSLAVLSGVLGGRATGRVAVAVAAGAWVLALLFDALVIAAPATPPEAPSEIAWPAALALALLVLVGLWSRGTRAYFAGLSLSARIERPPGQ